MKCFIENFLELDIDGLLAVNGGYGSSSKSYGATSSSGSGNQTSWEVWDANKDGRNSSGEITRPHDPYRDTPNNSGTYKSTSSGTIGSSDNSKLRDLFFDKDYIADLLKQQGFEDSLGGNKSGDASVEKENTEEHTEYSGDVTTQEPTDNSIIGDSVNDFADTDNENSESTGLDVTTASQEDTQSTLPSCEDTVDVTENEDSVLGAPTDSRRVTGVIGEKTTHQDAHTGIDIGAVEPGVKGDPIYAVEDGEIIRVGETDSKSSILVLDLPNTDDTAVYQHAEFTVSVGDTVEKGDVIGYMSDVGTPGQVHLHFEIREDGKYAGPGGTGELVDPLDYLPGDYTLVD